MVISWTACKYSVGYWYLRDPLIHRSKRLEAWSRASSSFIWQAMPSTVSLSNLGKKTSQWGSTWKTAWNNSVHLMWLESGAATGVMMEVATSVSESLCRSIPVRSRSVSRSSGTLAGEGRETEGSVRTLTYVHGLMVLQHACTEQVHLKDTLQGSRV